MDNIFPLYIKREEYLDKQLEKLGLSVEDISLVVCSHMHWDHSGGLCFFAEKKTPQKVLTSREDYVFGAMQTLAPYRVAEDCAYFRENYLFKNLDISFVEEDDTLCEGIDMILLQGHTPAVLGLVLYLESGTVICKRLIAKRVQAPEVFASESAAVSCFLSAAYVETGKLTAAISEVDEVVAQEVVNLTPKKRTLFGTLFASMLRSFWTALTVPRQKAEVLDAEFVPAQEGHTETVQSEGSAEFSASDQSAPEVEEKQEETVDEELNRIVGLFKLSREQGYTLKLIPGTPEENAPVFDFENERILRPAA